MKKLLVISLTVLLATLMIVSCSPDTKGTENGLALLSFSANERAERGLTKTNPVLDPEEFWWSYEAVKLDAETTGLTSGVTTQKTEIGTKGLKSTVGGFSYGEWKFTLYGYNNSDRTELAYQGTAEVTIDSKTTDLSVSVKNQSAGKSSGTLQIPTKGAIQLKLKDASYSSKATNLVEKVYIASDDATENTPATFTKTVYIESTSEVTNITLTSGSYAVTISYQSKKDPVEGDTDQTAPIVYATETIYVTIADYLTTKIAGEITENNGSVQFYAQGEIIKATASNQTIETNKATTITVNAAPISAESDTKPETTVSIPEAAVTGTKASLEVTTYSPAAIADGDAKDAGFTITSSTETNPVLGAIDIKLYAGEDGKTLTTTFADEKVLTITTKVAKGLNGGVDYDGSGECSIQVQYNGSGTHGTVTSYNATTGELTFTVTHLSTYYVVDTSAVIYNSVGDKVYAGLVAAVADATAGDTLILMKNTKIDVELDIDTSMTIDFNQKTLSFDNPLKDDTEESKTNSSYGNGIWIGNNKGDAKKSNPVLTFKNGNINGKVGSHYGIGLVSGTLKIEDMNLEIVSDSMPGMSILDASDEDDAAYFEMKNTTLNFTSNYTPEGSAEAQAAIYIGQFEDWNGGTVTIDNCEITAKSSVEGTKKVIGILINRGACKDITISNSTITSDFIGLKASEASTNYTIKLLNSTFTSVDNGACLWGGKYEITDSTFNATGKDNDSLSFVTNSYDVTAVLKDVKLVNNGLAIVDLAYGQKSIALSGTLTKDSVTKLTNLDPYSVGLMTEYEVITENDVPTIKEKSGDS